MKLAARNRPVKARLVPMSRKSTTPSAAMPVMTAMMIQARVLLRIAVARMICPTSRRMAPISINTMATILTDEMESAVPRNSAVTSRSTCEGITAGGKV